MNEIVIKNYKYLDIKEVIINLLIKENTIITIMEQEVKELEIIVNDDVEVIINDFRIIDKAKSNIKFEVHNKASLIYNHSFINNKSYNLNINTVYKGTESKIEINVHGINNSGKSNVIVDGDLGENYNNVLLENIRLMNVNEGFGSIIPNIIASNSQVIANHNATIGTVSNNELSYLMSKGISKEEAKKLILNGFIINLFNSKELITKIKAIIN